VKAFIAVADDEDLWTRQAAIEAIKERE